LDRVKIGSSALHHHERVAFDQATITELTNRIRRLKRRASRSLRIWLVAVTGVATMIVLGTAGWVASAPRLIFPAAVRVFDEAGDPGRGKHVFEAADCASCHASPGQPDNLRLGGGMALASPFGTLYPPNISPDPVDGIGRWSTRELANALLSGVSPSGTHYYPAFPYTSYTHMRLEDVRDLAAYLRTLPPVSGRTPPHDLPFPFSIRRTVGFWKRLYFSPGTIPPDPSRGAAWNRGRYLAEAVSHCAECHSPRDMLGGIKSAGRYAGGQDPEGVGYDPNIAPAGIGHWSRQDLIRVLTDGMTPDLRIVGGSMRSVVANTAQLPETDRAAIAEYIVSLPPRHSPDAVNVR
jgi:mono/diheme cytochrome c family protein